jgi:predicted NUDIX family phosphoesterase
MATAVFVDREAAERDESFKQVIPYCVLTREFRDEPMYLWYKRTKKGGESRLHEKYSLGVGGHVNPVDGAAAGAGTYVAGLARELREEIGLDVRFEYDWPKVEAAIYDPSDEVGRVHLGLVHIIPVRDGWSPESKDVALSLAYFTMPSVLKEARDRGVLENWSALVYDRLLAA